MRVAITGKIGSGKSAVLEILQKNGYSVFSADKIYADLLEKNADFVIEISEKMGIKAKICNGKISLDRKKIAEIIFSDDEKRKELNLLTHGKVMQELVKLSEGEELCFCEIPLLAEIDEPQKFFDEVWVVERDKEEQIKAIMQRDNVDYQFALKKINGQKKYVINSKIKHTVIYNDKSLSELEKRVLSYAESL